MMQIGKVKTLKAFQSCKIYNTLPEAQGFLTLNLIGCVQS